MAAKSHQLIKDEDAFSFLVAVLVHLKRKHGSAAYSQLEARLELFDVLEALRTAGYHVLPKGVIDSLRRTLGVIP